MMRNLFKRKKKSKKDWTELPPEMLEMIFSYCSVTDLLESVQGVCQKWRASVRSPLVWQTKTLSISSHNNQNYVESLVGDLPFLKNVSFDNATPESIAFVCGNCPSLERVQFNYTQVEVDLLSKLTCLTYLDIGFSKCTRLEIFFKECTFSIFPLLSAVIFRVCTTDGEVPLQLLNSCQFLEHLVCTVGNHLEDTIHLSLKVTKSSNKTPGKHNLRTFYLSGSLLCEQSILRTISQYPNLTALAIKHSLFDDSHVLKTIFIKPLPNLHFLDLSYSFSLSDRAFRSVVNACPNLRYLCLMRSSVYDETFALIINSLMNLQCLNLHGTHITSQHFHSIPVKLPHLTDLNVCACRRIDQTVLYKLLDKMPRLSIFHPRKGRIRGSKAEKKPSPFLLERNHLLS